jgi:hypothetical protein
MIWTTECGGFYWRGLASTTMISKLHDIKREGFWCVRSSGIHVRSVLWFLLVVTAAMPGFAVNLAVNPSFAGDTTGWVIGGAVVFDPAVDSTGVVGSGSAKSTFVAVAPSTGLAIHQCIAIGPGTYTFGGKVFVPSGQPVSGAGLITVSWFSGPDCVTGFLSANSVSSGVTGSFQTLSSGPIVAPAGAAHAWLTGQNNASGAGTHIFNFDDFVFDNGLAPVATPTLGPLALFAMGVVLAGIALVALRR